MGALDTSRRAGRESLDGGQVDRLRRWLRTMTLDSTFGRAAVIGWLAVLPFVVFVSSAGVQASNVIIMPGMLGGPMARTVTVSLPADCTTRCCPIWMWSTGC